MRQKIEMGHAALKAESVRAELVGMLPRLKRFAAVLANGRDGRDALLRDACSRMLDEQHRYQRGTRFDHWAFGEVYRLWLERLRESPQPLSDGVDEETAFEEYIAARGVDDPVIASFLASLSAQQRCALLLVHGEGCSYAEAAQILDAAEQTIVTRVARATAQLTDRLARKRSAPAAAIQPLFRDRPGFLR